MRQGQPKKESNPDNIRKLDSGGTGSEYLLKTGRWQKTWTLSKACVEATELAAIKRPPPVPAALACVEMTEKVVDHDDLRPSTKQNLGALLLF